MLRSIRKMIVLIALMTAMTIGSSLAEEKQLTVLFTSDIHSHFSVSTAEINGQVRERGGAGRLLTLVQENKNDHTIIVDAGDFAMGTLLQAGFSTDAYELRLLGRVGYDATTFGNHEFDLTCVGAANMIEAATASGDPLPMLLIPANLDLTGTLNEEQQKLKDAMNAAGSAKWLLKDVDGIKVAVFGVLGNDGIKCAPTSGVKWADPIESAKKIVAEIGDQADVIICVSHSGTNADMKSGEDVELIKQVTGIDVVISGHTHLSSDQAVILRDGSVLGAPGCFLNWLGKMDLTVTDDGKVKVNDYKLIPVDENVVSDPETDAVVDEFWNEIDRGYLADTGYQAQQVITHSDFTLKDDLIREEIPLCDLIADSYLYACREAGIDDVDVAIVGMGTVRNELHAGDITVADAFEVCSLGEGKDGSAGHPLVSVWIKGSDLKLVAEMDAFIGGLYHSVIINYSGLKVVYDANRIPLDRVTTLEIVHQDGTSEKVEMEKRYRVVANMYAINMLSSIQSMTKGIISLTPTDSDGKQVAAGAYYDYAVTKPNSEKEVKEWVAFCDYLSSFEKVDGVSQLPEAYRAAQGRKTITYGGLFEILSNPGLPTIIVLAIILLIVGLIVCLICTRKHRKEKRIAKRARKQAK